MKIYLTYKTVDKPWGGANNFLRSLKIVLFERYGVVFIDNIEEADIIFMNQVSAGPESDSPPYSIDDLKKFKCLNSKAKFIFRAVNLKWHSNPVSAIKYYFGLGYKTDKNIIRVLNNSDCVVYQSYYQKDFFQKSGAKPKNYFVILNGASNVFKQNLSKLSLNSEDTLKIIATANAKRNSKRHEVITAISMIKDVEVYYAGLWPENVPRGKIKFCGVLEHESLKKLMDSCHYFLHPAIHDPCPNSLIEGLFAGLPALYNSGMGSGAEIAKNYGIPINFYDLNKTILDARAQYNVLHDTLYHDRYKFGIERAAEEYFNIFQSAMVQPNG